MKIKILSDTMIDKIAAGEVVERPASIIKELLENSLDAGAKRIEVVFKGDGTRFIEVSDDGIGMEKDDLCNAFKRHATSKIENIDDLLNVQTLGFRGEALPSIAAVSKVTVLSKTSGSDNAHKYYISSENQGRIEVAARPPGTTITISDVFYNMPARKKFLKSEVTERKNIISTVESLALSRPDIRFVLKSDDKTVFDLSTGNLKERFCGILGKKISDKLLELEFSNMFVNISGYITDPAVNFVGRKKMYIFVNNRPVYSPLILHAVSEGFGTAIPAGRYPSCIINIILKQELVDVNVHPTKREVKFINQQAIHKIISRAVSNRLSGATPKLDDTVVSFKESGRSNIPASSVHHTAKVFTAQEKQTDYLGNLDLSKVTEFSFAARKESKQTESDRKVIGRIIPRFQWKNKYVIAEDDEGLIIIDQHTAWERINYEKLHQQFKDDSVISQGTLIPEVIELKHSQSELLSQNIQLLKKFGIHLEEFGPNTFKITAVTSIAGRVRNDSDSVDLIEEILGVLEEEKTLPGTDKMIDGIIKTIACRASIKAGDPISDDEVNNMVILLNKCRNPNRCPHGRPVIMRLDETEIDKKFQR